LSRTDLLRASRIRELLICGRLVSDQDLLSVRDDRRVQEECQRMSGNTEDVLEVLREVWSAQGQTAEGL